MIASQIVETLDFPLLVSVEGNSSSILIQDRENFPSDSLHFSVVQVVYNNEHAVLELKLKKVATLESLGYSFEAGM